jgi:response regulator RpfG family c-di-GMP phosphodiesterase
LDALGSQQFALVLSDQRMPGTSGAKLLAMVTRLSPDTIRVLFTAYSDIAAVIEAVNEGRIYRYLAKPWDAEQLTQVVEEAVQLYRGQQQRRELLERLRRLGNEESEGRLHASLLQEATAELTEQNQQLSTALDTLEEAVQQLRQLGTVVPVCMQCGKIKPTGGSWQDVADFLRKRTRFLTHGLCPNCTDLFNQGIDELEKRKP